MFRQSPLYPLAIGGRSGDLRLARIRQSLAEVLADWRKVEIFTWKAAFRAKGVKHDR